MLLYEGPKLGENRVNSVTLAGFHVVLKPEKSNSDLTFSGVMILNGI